MNKSIVLCFLFFLTNSPGLITTAIGGGRSFVLTNETDLQALLEIKKLILGDGSNVFTSWNLSTHLCAWQGVMCGPRHQRVTVLNLSSLGLAGSVSPHIGNLTFLRTIDLSNNTFHGTIPQAIGRLFRLQSLSLPNNSFQGKIPTNLTRCSNLGIMDLSSNHLDGKIPTELGSLSGLIQLILKKNNLFGTIPTSIGNLSSLSVLSLAHNSLKGSIPFELAQLSKLESLLLQFNNLSGMVPTSLYNISSINHFSLSDNLLHGSLPPDLGFNLPKLRTFFASANQFNGPIPPSIGNASGLLEIDMTLNSFTRPLPMNIGNLHELNRLLFYSNKLGLGDTEGDELTNFVASLSNCSKLQLLDLGGNLFQGSVPDSIANLSTTISLLVLDENYFSGSIPLGIGNLVNLLTLAFESNMLTGSIPDSIGKLSGLEVLFMSANNISGEIPSTIGNLTQLGTLDLHRNMIGGSIPVSLGNCTNLQGVHLGFNLLTGTIPQQIFGLSSLFVLFLFQNYLTGELPPQVGNLKNLGKLAVSDNQLSGKIPGTLGSCQVLEQLYMEGNLFEGTIPPSFQQLKGIQLLDLSLNNLSGQIPEFLGELHFQYLNLSYNMFDGEVPSEGVFRNISAFSVVGNNKLCGGIEVLGLPACPILKGKKHRFNCRVIALLVVPLIVILLLACLAVILYKIRRSRLQVPAASPLQNQYLQISYGELLQATDGFSSANLIGEGRYSSVYRGILKSGEQTVAVKVLNVRERGGNKSFVAECEALKNIRHRNLVKIITSCSSIDFKGNDFRALVFDFMENGSLENWLYPRSLSEQRNTNSLNVAQRLNIAIDVASALDYLHHCCEVAIIHCDLKPSNVLLDDDFCAHVSDFGLARILLPTTGLSINHQQSSSTGIRGTIGYVAPEYGMGDEISTRGDMYSYGVLLLEMFIGKRPTDNMFTDGISLPSYAKMSLPDQVMKIIDPLIIPEDEEQASRTRHNNTTNTDKLEVCLASILQIGVSCSAELPSERMNSRDVLLELHKIRDEFLVAREQRRQDGRRNDS